MVNKVGERGDEGVNDPGRFGPREDQVGYVCKSREVCHEC